MLQKYGLAGFLLLIINKLRTIFFYSPARLIRFPFDIRNKKNISIGKGFTTGRYCRIEAHPNVNNKNEPIIKIGENVQFNDAVHIVGGVGIFIGNNVLLASKIFITDLSHGSYGANDIHDTPLSIPKDRALSGNPVVIEDNVWIGEFVSILPGVTIGKGSIIGTLSVVNKSIPPNCIAVGSPVKIIKQYNFETQKWERV